MKKLIPGFIPEEDVPVADENTEHYDRWCWRTGKSAGI